MSRHARDAVWQHSKSSGSALTVMLCLAEHSNEEKLHKSWPGIERIAERTRLTTRQVKRHLKALRRLGELHVDLQAGTSRQNEYWLLLPGLPASPGHFKKELTSDPQAAGGALSKGLPDASKGLAGASKGEGDIQGKDTVTSKAGKGDTHVTQTFSEPKKENLSDPLNPPKGDEVESDFDFWIEGIASLFNQEASSIPKRYLAILRKNGVPPRDAFKVLKCYMEAADPEKWDCDEQAKLLRCRKQKVSTVIRNLSEVLAKAKRFAQLMRPAGISTGNELRTVPEPDFDWRAIVIDLFYSDPEPNSFNGRPIAEQDRVERAEFIKERQESLKSQSWDSMIPSVMTDVMTEHQKRMEAAAAEFEEEWRAIAIDLFASHKPPDDVKNAETREHIENTSWERVPFRDRQRIRAEYARRQVEKKKAGPRSDVAGVDAM